MESTNYVLSSVIATGLLKLITKNKEIAEKPETTGGRVTPKIAKAGLKAMGVFAKNFLPILMSLFGKLEIDEYKQPILAAISAYASIADPSVLSYLCLFLLYFNMICS